MCCNLSHGPRTAGYSSSMDLAIDTDFLDACRAAAIDPAEVDREDLGRWLAHGFSTLAALEWISADCTIDQARGWDNHGCGPGDAAGCWTRDPDEAFAGTSDDDSEDE